MEESCFSVVDVVSPCWSIDARALTLPRAGLLCALQATMMMLAVKPSSSELLSVQKAVTTCLVHVVMSLMV
jgi:hypothetical protein